MSGKPGFVFVHGAWHNRNTWDRVVPFLQARGHLTTTLDLPGAGKNARLPKSWLAEPFDAQAFATEPSPNAGTTQAERTEAVINAVRETAAKANGRVVLVGHSLGGATVSHVAEAVPELLAATVYVTAFMLPPGMMPVEMIQDPVMADALVPSLFAVPPPELGAMRVNFRSTDPEYRERIRQAYCGDIDGALFEEALSHLHCDEPAQVTTVPSPVSKERFGTVPRHYVFCSQDRAVTPAGQRKMIELMDAAMGNATAVHSLASSHSPFDSQPEALAAILAEAAAG